MAWNVLKEKKTVSTCKLDHRRIKRFKTFIVSAFADTAVQGESAAGIQTNAALLIFLERTRFRRPKTKTEIPLCK